MVDAHALGACGETRGGSSPLPPIKRFCDQRIVKNMWFEESQRGLTASAAKQHEHQNGNRGFL